MKNPTLHTAAIVLLTLLLIPARASAQSVTSASRTDASASFHLTSAAFENNTTLPLSAINNNLVNGSNTCSPNGSPGGNQSPELSWGPVDPRAQSFVVTVYDATAAFTHWGMYNIAADVTELPQNAGVAGSLYGTQILNDFFVGNEYDGPCPPANVRPDTHRYIFTVYELDTRLVLVSSPNFPPTAESLDQALIRAGKFHHILNSASMVGLYSSTPTH